MYKGVCCPIPSLYSDEGHETLAETLITIKDAGCICECLVGESVTACGNNPLCGKCLDKIMYTHVQIVDADEAASSQNVETEYVLKNRSLRGEKDLNRKENMKMCQVRKVFFFWQLKMPIKIPPAGKQFMLFGRQSNKKNIAWLIFDVRTIVL